MNTYTPPVHGHHSLGGWSLKHPLVSTIAVIAAAVAAGVLIGVLFGVLSTTPASQHRAGGHAMATVAAARDAAAMAIAAIEGTSSTPAVAAHGATRSPARAGFAVGRTEGAGAGYFTVSTAKATGVNGFPGRSIGANGGDSLLAMHTGKITGVNGFPGRAIGAGPAAIAVG